MNLRVELLNDGSDVILRIGMQLPNYTVQNMSEHRVPKSRLTSFEKLDAELMRVGYRRTGDWHNVPGGGIATVESIAKGHGVDREIHAKPEPAFVAEFLTSSSPETRHFGIPVRASKASTAIG